VPNAPVPKPIQHTVQRVPNFPEVKRPERDANHPSFLEPGRKLVETIIMCVCVCVCVCVYIYIYIYRYTVKKMYERCKVFYYELHKTKYLLMTLNNKG
jgi:hypothetical protein